MEDHVGRLDWRRDQIERHQTQRLRSLLSYARERSPFHAERLAGLDPSLATVADLASLPMMTKQDAQDRWDTIVTAPDLDRRGAEQILAQQQWFSYTAADEQIFSSGGSSGVRGVYVWDWQFLITAACLAWRTQTREQRRTPVTGPALLAVLEAGVPPHASTPLFDVPTTASMQTVVIEAAAPFDEVLAAVAAAQPTHLVGYPSVVARLARATLSGALAIRRCASAPTPNRCSTTTGRQSAMHGTARCTTCGAPLRSASTR
jgi:phenylacetate-coenzyme A ligase PaaK-like adenylate-forming protein